jgi:hypothetical protein
MLFLVDTILNIPCPEGTSDFESSTVFMVEFRAIVISLVGVLIQENLVL